MHHYYTPCAQQDRQQYFHHSSDKRFTSVFRRSPSQSSAQAGPYKPRKSKLASWRQSQHNSLASPPSLGNSSPSSLEDESSPKTPSPSDHDRIEQKKRTVFEGNPSIVSLDAPSTYMQDICDESKQYQSSQELTRPVRALPCRLKRSNEAVKVSGNQSQSTSERSVSCSDVAQPTIYETAVRSRLSRSNTKTEEQFGLREVDTNRPAAVVTFNSRCHARRRPCAEAKSVAPPKLKRDTDCTDAIVKLIVCFSTKLVHAIWTQSADTPKTSTAFNGAGVLPLRVFIQETLRRSKTSYSTLQVALFYLILLKPHVSMQYGPDHVGTPACRALQCGRRMFLTALILASKYLQDRNYSSRAWSKISGLPITEINENERRYLELIEFKLHMKKEAFENWSKIVLTLCKVGETSMSQEAQGTNVDANHGSNNWWSYQLRRLTDELVQSTSQTDDYIASLTGLKTTSDLIPEQLTASLDTPPSSPDSIGEMVPESNQMKSFLEDSADPFSIQKLSEHSESPRSFSALPSRPNLPNLPTPSTTPRYNNVLPWPKGPCQLKTRCQASSQALLNLDKQAVNVANLETCPPPKPRRSCLSRQISCPVRRTISNLATASLTSSLTCSPESTVSDTSSGTCRSRSSSISSTSSTWWPSGVQNWIDERQGRLLEMCKENVPSTFSSQQSRPSVPASYGFYHPSDSATCGFEDEGVAMNSSANSSHPAGITPVRFQDEGYGSDCLSQSDRGLAEKQVGLAYGVMEHHKAQTASCPAVASEQTFDLSQENVQSRPQKRDRSSTLEETLHEHVRHLLWTDSQDSGVVDNSFLTTAAGNEKELQFPVKDWASLKVPVPNTSQNKRMAMQQPLCQSFGAPHIASGYLKDVAMLS